MKATSASKYPSNPLLEGNCEVADILNTAAGKEKVLVNHVLEISVEFCVYESVCRIIRHNSNDTKKVFAMLQCLI